MKRLLTAFTLIAVMNSCSSAAASADEPYIPAALQEKTAEVSPLQTALPWLFNQHDKSDPIRYVYNIELIKKQQRIAQEQRDRVAQFHSLVGELKGTAGNTWYVFSGNTPRGWDCSGLVMWFYGQLGVTLEHRASLQAKSGIEVDKPMVGDIVAFYYHGASEAHHVGIYIGHGKFISAPRPGTSTAIERVAENQFILDGSEIRFIRISALSESLS
jgi:cell wall-associated NlpC family hydrolase